jgi:arylsulfatase A-like enzyme
MQKARPNIVYILADDLGYGDLSCYGAEKIKTPNIDYLAGQGMRFSDAHSTSAVCTPSRYSVLTGRYCWKSRLKKGVLGGFSLPLIENDRATVATLLKSQGYETACIGKWHLGLRWYKKNGEPKYNFGNGDSWKEWSKETGFDIDYEIGFEDGPLKYGFDYFFGIAGSLDMPPYCFLEDNNCIKTPDREKGFYFPQQRRGLQSEDWDDQLCDFNFTRKAVQFIEQRKNNVSDKPFFLYLPTAAPHRPCLPPFYMKNTTKAGPRGDMVAMFDWVVGQVILALKRENLWENTLLFVTSDNGARLTCYNGRDYGHKSNGNLRGQKADIWEGGHREPLIIVWEGMIQPASTCNKTVCLSDLLATIADIIGAEIPENSGEDSISIYPLLQGKDRYERETLIHHSAHGVFAIRKDRWKLITKLGSGGFSEPVFKEPVENGPKGQLYDIVSDPQENNNLWCEKPEIVTELEKLLEDYK